MTPLRISVLYNKPTARFATVTTHLVAEEDTEESAQEVAAALKSKGAEVTMVPVTEKTIQKTVGSLRGDLIFNLIEWTGVDLPFALQTFDALNSRGLLYTGATKENYHITGDKALMKKRLEETHLPTPSWQLFRTGREHINGIIHFPVIVKVSREHSSVGLTSDAIIAKKTDLPAAVTKRIAVFAQPVYAEEFLTGREFQITLLERANGCEVLPPSEIEYRKDTNVPFLTYESRWDATHPDFDNSDVVLPKLDPELSLTLFTMCRKAFTVFGFRDYARFDIRCRGNAPMFLEVNSNPGLSDDNQYGMTVSYKAIGMTFADFVWEIVESALRRGS